MHAALLLAAVALAAALAAAAAASSPYDPHTPPAGGGRFFEGWFVRLTAAAAAPGAAPRSAALGIGHLPAAGGAPPPPSGDAVCFLLVEPGAAGLGGSGGGAAEAPRVFTSYLGSLDVARGEAPWGCAGCPAFVVAGRSGAGACRLEVRGDLVDLQAEFDGGAVKLSARNDPSTASVTPWGQDGPGSSPEGWLPASLLRLHWYVWSVSTPVSMRLTLDGLGGGQGQGRGGKPGGGNGSSAGAAGAPGGASAAAAPPPAAAWAHLEKNWGEGFPEQWVWAQGSDGGQASFALAGGPLPLRRLPLGKAPAAAASAWRGLWRLAARAGALPGWPLPFAFSFHSPSLNMTVDPSHPGWATSFAPCGCCGTLEVTLTGWSRLVVVRAAAPPGSFAGVPCPTPSGFRIDSDESFATTVHVRVYGGGWAARLGRGGPRPLLASAAFKGAALEFGGRLRCSGGAGAS